MQYLGGPAFGRFEQSAFLESDFYSNSIGQEAANDFYWGDADGSLAQTMANQIGKDGVLSQQEAQAQVDAACKGE